MGHIGEECLGQALGKGVGFENASTMWGGKKQNHLLGGGSRGKAQTGLVFGKFFWGGMSWVPHTEGAGRRVSHCLVLFATTLQEEPKK